MSGGGARLRFAPSPTGSLHLGNARTALFNWLGARREGGTFLLRIEDTDTEREQRGSEAAILEDLRWLGLAWDEGPDIGGPVGPYRQSERGEYYRGAVERLLAVGRAYRCFCTDDEIRAERDAQAGPVRSSGYSGRCREISEAEAERRAASGEAHAVRFRTVPAKPRTDDLVVRFHDRLRGEVSFSAIELGDPVLVRRDGRPTYNFAVIVDDLAMGITLVLRGDDHLSNTPRQVLVCRALGEEPPELAHIPMVRGPDGERLSKRHGATSVAEFRRLGYPREAVLNALALMGWAPSGDRTVVSVDEMIAEFELDRLSKSPAIFDPAKLDWLAGQYVHTMRGDRLAREVGARLIEAGALPADAATRGAEWIGDLAELLRTTLTHFDQVVERCKPLFRTANTGLDADAAAVLADTSSQVVAKALAEAFAREAPVTHDAWARAIESVKAATGFKGKALFHPIRAALTGQTSGPELDRLVPLMASGNELFPDRIASPLDRLSRVVVS